MFKHTSLLIKSFLSIVFLIATGGSALGAEAGNAPVSGVENLLRGTKYEQLLIENRGKPSTLADKGIFVPNFGNYFDTDNPGWGLDIQGAGDLIFAVWFTYLADGSPYWYIIVGGLEAKGGGMTMTGGIDSFKWDRDGAPGNQATATTVGTMTIAWSDTSNADVSWTLDGVDGSAPVEFFQFSNDPTLGNMTGHYFNFFAPGWGFTLLTQGSVTAMTMYWYKNGQPVWAQGVVGGLGANPVMLLLYFNGPGLCPACLPRKGGGPTTTPLAQLQLNWGVGLPPQVRLERFFGPVKGGPLGANPFDDIPLGLIPITTEAITSAFQDYFDPTYSKMAGKGGASGCIPFMYDPGFLTSPPAISGAMESAYAGLPATSGGRIPVFTDPVCTASFLMDVFGVPRPSYIITGSTDPEGEGNAFDWSAHDPFDPARKGDEGPCDDDDDFDKGEIEGNCYGEGGDAGWDNDKDDRAKGVARGIRIYGSNPYAYQRVGAAVARFPGTSDTAPALEAILENPDDNMYIFIPLDD